MFYQATKFTKWAAAFFLLVILLPLLVSISLHIYQQIIRHEMLELLEAKNLTALTIKKSSVKWIREGSEMEVGGELFDVKEIKENGCNILVKGLFDQTESKLLRLIEKSNRHTHNNPLQVKVSKVLAGFLYINYKTDSPLNSGILTTKRYQLYDSGNYLSFSPALTGPPPKYC
jgi:hypothetical protein